MKNFYSISSFLFVIAATLVVPFTSLSQCDYTIAMTDSWGDGWNGASITVTVNGNPTDVTCSGASTTSTVATEDGAVVTFDWNGGGYDSECSVTITAPDGSGIYQGGSFTNQITDVSNAPGCDPPPLCAQSGVEANGIVVDIAMTDSYNDGWDGASISVCIDGNTDYTSSFTSGGSDSHSFALTEGQVYNINYTQGSYESEHSYTVTVDGVQVYSSGTSPSPGVQNYGSYCNSAAAISGTLAACESSTSQLTFSGASGGVWSSSDAGVASVSGSGLVTANSAGSATITYTSANGSADCDASYSVTFNTLSAPSSGTISGTSDIAFGSTSQLTTSGDAGGTWSSDNTSVATVDASTGLVTSVSAGSATITYTISAAGCTTSSSTYSVNVVNPSPDTCFDLASLPGNFINGDNGTLSWVSGSQSTPSSSTGPTTGFGGTPGMFYVEASGIYNLAHDLSMMVGISSASSPVVSFDYSMYGAAMGTLEVLVDGTSIWSLSGNQGTDWQSAVVAIDISTISDLNNVKITFRGTTGSSYTSDFALDNICILDCSQVGTISGTLSLCDPGETSQLSQDGASGGVWSSDNTAIATVNSSGLVTAVAQGSVNILYTIAASGSCPESSVSAAFVVVGVPDGGTITGTTSLDIGQSSTLTSDGSTGGSWSSDDQTVATVDASSGNITAVGPGTATITYTVAGEGCSSASSNIVITVSSDIIAPTSGSIDVTICSGNLYDDGGVSGNYSNSSSQVVTLYPSTAGSFINVAGTFDSEANYDGATFYDGTNTSATVLGSASGSGLTIDYTASNVDGAITIAFTADGSVNDAGFALVISCQSPCSGTPATATAVMTQADFCTGTAGSLSASGIESGLSGLSYYWDESQDGGTTWTNVGLGQFTNDELSATLDNVQYRYVTSCSNSGLSSTSNVIIKKFADLTAGSDVTVCPNESLSLTATQTYSSDFDVEWYAAASGGTALATGSPYSPSPSVTTTYYAASSGCPDTRVAVIANISELTSAYGDASTCTGVDATLTGTYTGNGVTFSWSPTTGLNDATAAIPTSSASTGLTYTLTLTDNLSCSITDDVVLTITESTAGTLSATSTTFAVAETSTVSTDGTTGGTFVTSDASVATVDVSTGVVTGVSAGTVTITYTTPECSGQSYSNTIDLTIACDAGTVSLTSSSVNIGETSTASSSGTAGGSWSSDNTAVATVDASTGVVTSVTAGSANITYTTSTACGSEMASASISVTCASDLVVTYDDAEHCSGNSSTISGTVSDPDESYTYTFSGYDSYGDSWNGNAVDIIVDGVTVVSGFANQSAAAGVAETVTFSAGASSVITLSWTPGSFQGEVSWDIKIPGLFILSSGDYGDTDGGTTSYSAAVYTYSWSPTTDLDDATSSAPVSSVTVSTNYTLTVTNQIGCTGSDAVAVTVSNPTAGTLTGTQSINPGATTTISTDGTSGGSFSSSDDAVATVDPVTGVVTGVTAGSVTITYTTPAGCPEQTATISVTVTCASDLVVTYDDVEHCSGNSSTISGTVSDPDESYTYTFSGYDSYGDSWNGNAVDIIVDGVTVVSGFANQSAAGGVAETVTFSAGASSVITLSWTPGSYQGEVSWDIKIPGLFILSSGDYGDTDGGTTSYSTATYTYSWTPSTGLDDATIASPTASNSTTETYTITVTNSLGCAGTDDVIATVSNPTAGTLSGTTTIAPEGTTTISSDGTTGGVWESDDTAVATVDASTGVVTGGIAGSATITYTVGGTTCPDASTITVNVVCDAYTVVYDDITFCDGTPTTLSQTSNSQNSTYEFYGVDSWGDGWNGASLDISVNGVTVLTGVEVTAYNVSAYFDAPAGATIGFDWTPGSYNSEISWELYDASANLLDDGDYGDVSSSIPGSAPTYTYSWSPSTGLDDASIMEPTSSASTTTVYTVTVTDGFGCVATDDVTATVNPLYTPTVTIVSSDADNEICSGDAVTFTATAVDAGNPTYVWNIGGSPVSGETASSFTTTTLADGDEVTVTVTADNTCQTVNEVTSTGITTTVNAVTAGTIEASVDGGTSYSNSQQVIQAGNDIYWNYTSGSATGTFTNFEYQWGGTTGAYADNWGATTNPWNWGAGQSGVNPNQTIYVRAKASCGSNVAYSDPVAVDWLTCYGGATEIATSTSDGGSIVDGGNMTVNSTISWTAPTDAFGDAYHWEYSWNGGSSFNGEWQNNTNPATWSDNVGSQADNTLTIRYVATGAGSCSDNSVSDFDVTVLRPVITVSAMSGDLAVCSDGDASSSETFTVEGLYIANDDNNAAAAASHTGILVTAPAGLEISLDNSTFGSSLNLSATNGTVSQTTIYARIIAGQGASDVSGDIACTAQAANTQNVSAVATIDENAEIETSVSFTGTTTCGEVSIDVQVNGVSAGSGAWTALSGLFLSATDVATTFTTSTFGSTITLTWTSSNGACTGETTSMDVEFNQPTTSTIDGYGMDTESWIWGGLTDDDWSEPSNWYAYTTDLNNNSYWERQTVNVPSATDKVYIMANSDAGQCISSSNSAIATPGAAVTDLMVANGATLNLSGATSIKGDLTNDGTINAGSSTLTFDGTSDQTVSGNALTLDNLTVNKTSGNLIMSTPINVNGILDLSSNVNNGSNVLSVGTSSASLGSIEQNGGIVLGKLRRYFANASGSKSFPVGIAGTMRDVAVDFVSAPGTDQYITASYNTGYPQANDGSDLYEGLPLTTSDNQLIQNYDDEGYWEIIPGSSSTGDSYIAPINGKQYNVTLHCNNLTGADNVTNMDRTKVRMIKSAGPGHTSWEALTHVSISGDDADFLLTASGTGFSFFGAGTEDDNALPVELVSFSGDCNDGVVDLIWQTASEQSSEDFEIEYSRDGVDWSLIHTEPAAGFSNELITYNFSHKQAISGNNYYRLTQNDIDGTAMIYNNLIINASCQSTSDGYFSVFPNPSSGNFQVIMNNPEIEGAAQLRIVDTKGNEVFMKSIEVNSGINMFVIQQDLAPGIYYINIENNSRTTNVVKHSIR